MRSSLSNCDEDDGRGQPVERYEIEVRYNNGDSIEGRFKDKVSAIEFLLSYRDQILGRANSFIGQGSRRRKSRERGNHRCDMLLPNNDLSGFHGRIVRPPGNRSLGALPIFF